MSFGGGGGGSPATISPSKEYSKILNVFQNQALPAFQSWVSGQPLLGETQSLAQSQYGALPGYAQGVTQGYQTGQAALKPLPGMIKAAYGSGVPESQLSNLALSAYRGSTPTAALKDPLLGALGSQITPILQSGGALTPQLTRLATQQALADESRAGMAHTNAAIASALLNRDVYRQQRFNTALGQAEGIGQTVSGLDTAALQRALGTSAGIEALNQGGLQRAQGAAQSLYALGQAPFQNALAYAQAQQGLSQGTAQGLYGAELAPISAWGGLFNPTAQNVSDVIGYNLNAQNQANIASQNKTGSAIGGGLGALGSIAGGVGIAL